MIAAGTLDRRIAFERATAAQASPSGEQVLTWATEETPSGEQVLTWATEETVWAEVAPLGGRELFQAQQLEAKADTRFRIRYRTGITPDEKLRISYGGRYYDLRSVVELGRREGLEILAEARTE